MHTFGARGHAEDLGPPHQASRLCHPKQADADETEFGRANPQGPFINTPGQGRCKPVTKEGKGKRRNLPPPQPSNKRLPI